MVVYSIFIFPTAPVSIQGLSRKVKRRPITAREYRYTKEKPSLLARMKKIEGQAKGIQRMVEEDRYCIDIVQQLTALSAAVDEVSLLILQDHIEGCVTSAIREQHGEGHIKELIDTLRKAMRR